MPVAEDIREKLASAFAPMALAVSDDSAQHAGHAGSRPGGETHFTAHIVSEKFTGMTRLERQRAVHAVLAAELAGPVHALVIRAFTPSEAALAAASP